MLTIDKLIARNGRKYPEHTAVIDHQPGSGRKTYDWQTLDAQSNQLAQFLKQRYQLQSGQRVGLFLPNGYAFVLAYYAIQKLGCIVVPINVKLTAPELDYILDNAGAKVVLTHSLTQAAVIKLIGEPVSLDNGTLEAANDHYQCTWLDDIPALIESYERGVDNHFIEPSTPCTLLYTSGTTGRPKGVLFNHQRLLAVATMMACEMEMKPSSKLLELMPFTHSAPLNLFLLAGTLVGATHVIAPTFTPDLLLDLVEGEQTTHFFGAPVAYLLTAQQPDISKRNLQSMTHWVYGGAPLSTAQVEAVRKGFNTNALYCVYGLTEAGPTGTLLMPDEHDEKAGSVGKRAALHTEVRLVDEQGQDPGVNTPGEIELSGDGCMLEYWQNPTATDEIMTADGWLKTGDIAVRDADGFYWIVDRKKDIIISGGVNVYPREVETALLAHPAIADAAVIGVENPQWGESVKACLVLKQPIDDLDATLKAFLAEQLADYKLPRSYEVLDELPRNANGKVLKHKLS